ncbi:MAG: hypothetical protein ABS939_00775 [Psychrobacillus sp.]
MKMSGYRILAVISVIFSFVFGAKGLDRLTKYSNPEDDIYASESINAWVGGDAYNYIINGTHATAFFVLAIGLLIVTVLLEMVHHLAQNQAKATAVEETPERPTVMEMINANKEA